MILADQCVFEKTIRMLQGAGYTVTRLKELGAVNLPDDQVLVLARQNDLILLTNDKDFSSILLYPPAQHEGIIVLKMKAQTEADGHAVLLQLLNDRGREDLRHKLAIVDSNKYRLRS